MDLRSCELGILQTNCYVIGNDDQLVIIDPGHCPDRFLELIENDGRRPAAILLTHGHFDHILGVDPLVRRFGMPVYALDKEELTLTNPDNNLAAIFTQGTVNLESEVTYFSEGDVLEIAGLSFETIWVPGHSYGGCCYYLRSEGVLFSGDGLFYGSIGRTDGPQGDLDALVGALKEKVLTLPEETAVYPGHGPATKIGFEKRNNPFLG